MAQSEQLRPLHDDAPVSPYLMRPLRSLEQALAERAAHERRERGFGDLATDPELVRSLDDMRVLLDREFEPVADPYHEVAA